MTPTISTQHVLTTVEAYASHVLSAEILHNLLGFETYVKVFLPQDIHGLVMTMVSLFAAENIKDVTIKVPLNWWEHFKEASAPQMWLDRWPVKYRVHHIAVKAIWQGYKPPPGEYGPFLCYVQNNNYTIGEEY
jgi:hypothetical protein